MDCAAVVEEKEQVCVSNCRRDGSSLHWQLSPVASKGIPLLHEARTSSSSESRAGKRERERPAPTHKLSFSLSLTLTPTRTRLLWRERQQRSLVRKPEF